MHQLLFTSDRDFWFDLFCQSSTFVAFIMTLQELSELYSVSSSVEALLGAKSLQAKSAERVNVTGLNESARALVVCSLFKRHKRPLLIVADSEEEAGYFHSDISAIVNNGQQVYLFPSQFHNSKRQRRQDECHEIQRTELLSRLIGDTSPVVIVSYAEALSEPVVGKTHFAKQTISIHKGDTIEQTALIEQLVSAGFKRVDFVYEPGQVAVRGSIVDIFSFSHEEPYRLDFFGDEIDSIRIFDIETQLSKERLQRIEIIPELDKSTNNKSAYLIDYLPADTICVCTDFALFDHRLLSFTDNESLFNCFTSLSTIEIGERQYFSGTDYSFNTLPQPIFHKNFDLLISTLKQYSEEDYHIYISSDSKKQIDRITAIFEEKGAGFSFIAVDRTLHAGFIDREAKLCVLTDHQIFERFHKVVQKADTARKGQVLLTLKELNQLQIGDYVVHVDHGIGRFGGLVRTTVNGKPQEMIKLIYRDNDILFVSIHSLHRISKYRGKDSTPPNISKLGSGQWERMKDRTKQKVKDIARDLIRLYAERRKEKGFQYSPDSYMQHELEASFLYEDTPDQQKATIDFKHDMESPVPMDRLICGDVGFGKTEIAMRAAFKAATDGKQTAVLVPTTVLALQHYNTFSERFKNFPIKVEYLSRSKSPKEQKEILQDLVNGKIDILIGTHKLVGKQVHFKDLGLLIIDEEQKFGVATKEKLRQLKVNVDTLTLTATPIPRTLQFSLLGARDLSIMTTPPPNRYPVQTELITLDDEEIIKDAIQDEINRNGQVFVVNNRIQALPTIEQKIRRLCPEARIVVAHGQMPPEQMEERLTDFINYDYDVLIATSIIESGVDIPNVNTIIIHHAEMFGLSDLHQLRGRVGRSNRKAYCFMVTPELELLTEDARRRLKAIETFADLGSGFHIAMQDLDIRGAGNMLGAEQSGFIADLGYETYQRILNEAVLELKEEEFGTLFAGTADDLTPDSDNALTAGLWVSDCQLESDLEICFPQDYIENISERITLYRELDELKNERELVEFKKRLIDRFGTLPEQALELLSVVQLRWKCMLLGIEKIVLKQERMTIFFPQNQDSPYYQSDSFGAIINYIVNHPRRCQLREANMKRSAVISNVKSIREAFDVINQIERPNL